MFFNQFLFIDFKEVFFKLRIANNIMNQFIIGLSTVILSLVLVTTAQAKTLKFKDYPAERHVGLNYTNPNDWDNPIIKFAGDYSLDSWSCGTGCTNRIPYFQSQLNEKITLSPTEQIDPHVTCPDGSKGAMYYKPYSRLLIIKGSINSQAVSWGEVKSHICKTHYYLEKYGELLRIK